MALRCLIVDDNDHFLTAARALLEQQGIAVVGVASTCHDAILKIDDLRPDVALIDIDLGDDCGFELAEQLAERLCGHDRAHRPGQPSIILISAYGETDFIDMIADSPAVAFLTKSDISAGAIHHILQTHTTEDCADPGRAQTGR